MNILVNAAQAIEKTGEIKIATTAPWTARRKSASAIRVAASPRRTSTRSSIRSFTTKDVGKGTGLGMNIAYNIITQTQWRHPRGKQGRRRGPPSSFTCRSAIAAGRGGCEPCIEKAAGCGNNRTCRRDFYGRINTTIRSCWLTTKPRFSKRLKRLFRREGYQHSDRGGRASRPWRFSNRRRSDRYR